MRLPHSISSLCSLNYRGDDKQVAPMSTAYGKCQNEAESVWELLAR